VKRKLRRNDAREEIGDRFDPERLFLLVTNDGTI
jgi:hypothetical protein